MNEDNVLYEETQTDSLNDSSPAESIEADDSEQVSVETEETSPEPLPEDSPSALDELIEAIKKELETEESTEESEAKVSEAQEENSSSVKDEEDAEDSENYEDEVDLVDDIHPAAHRTYANEAYTLASDSNASGGYEETMINRMDNILTCSIITACCAVLILFHTLKKE